MKSTSSFTVLPEGALYVLSNMSFMMRVGGQSGTAIRSTTSPAEAEPAPAPPISAAVAVAPASTASFLTQVMFRFPPDGLLVPSSSGVQGRKVQSNHQTDSVERPVASREQAASARH